MTDRPVGRASSTAATAWREWADALFAFARVRGVDESVAADVTQDAILAAIQKGLQPTPRADRDERDWAWMLGVLRHKLADRARHDIRWRQRHDRLRDQIRAAEGEPQPLLAAQHEEARAACRLALTALPPRHQAALTAIYLEGATVPTFAASAGLHPKAAESLLLRARRSLEAELRRLLTQPEDLLP